MKDSNDFKTPRSSEKKIVPVNKRKKNDEFLK